MRVRAAAATAALLVAVLTACGGDDGDTEKKNPAPSPSASVDCMDEDISQADWMAHCSDEGAEAGGEGTEQ